jgi:hypothetical protein
MEISKSLEKIIPYSICLIIAILGFSLGYKFNTNTQKGCQNLNCSAINKTDSSNSNLGNKEVAAKQELISDQEWLIAKVIDFSDNSITIENPSNKKVETVPVSKDIKFTKIDGTEKEPVTEIINKPNFQTGDIISIRIENSLVVETLFNPPPTGQGH